LNSTLAGSMATATTATATVQAAVGGGREGAGGAPAARGAPRRQSGGCQKRTWPQADELIR